MILSDQTINEELFAGRLAVYPLGEGAVQPASIDLRLGPDFLVFTHTSAPYIDTRALDARLTERVSVGPDQPFILHPGDFVLASTIEHVELPSDIIARLEGKSSLGRLGLMIHSTAGYVDPGWYGQLTLELSNVAKLPIALYAGMYICQISFLRMTTAAEWPYGSSVLGSKYQGQVGPTASRAKGVV